MQFSDFGVTRRESLTKGGIRVVVYELPHRPIALTAVFDAGRRYDPDGLECLAHTAEHMLVAGTTDLPSKDKVAAYIERLGGAVGASTGISDMRLNLAVGNASDFEAAVYLTDQLLVHSRYDEDVFEKELESVRQELAALTGNPGRFVQRRFNEQLFANTSLGGKLMDNQSAIDKLSIDDVRKYAKRRLTANNLTIVIAGGITIRQAVDALDNGLNLRPGTISSEPSPLISFNAPKDRIVSRTFTSQGQVHISYGFPGYYAGHPDSPVLEVLATVIGGGRASSLSRILRYEAGLVYSVSSHNSSGVGFGSWKIVTASNPLKAKEVIRLINDELKRATTGGITIEELIFAQDKLIKSAPIAMDSVGALRNFHAISDLFRLPETTRLPGFLRAIAAVSTDDLARVSKDIFRTGASVITLCGELPTDIEEADLF